MLTNREMNNTEEMKTQLQEALGKSSFIKNMGLEITEIDENHAVGRVHFDEKIQNPYGTAHGGFLFALADTVAGSAAAVAAGVFCTTIDGSMNYLEPGWKTEYIWCYAYIIRVGKQLVNVRVEIKDDDGKMIDTGDFNYFKLEK